jgi:hypothetical protein
MSDPGGPQEPYWLPPEPPGSGDPPTSSPTPAPGAGAGPPSGGLGGRGTAARQGVVVAGSSRREREAVQLLTRARSGVWSLRLAGGVLGVIWLITALSSFATEWHSLDGQSGGGFGVSSSTSTIWKLTSAITVSGQASWGYAIGAVLAFAAAVALTRAEAADALAELDDLDDLDETGGLAAPG